MFHFVKENFTKFRSMQFCSTFGRKLFSVKKAFLKKFKLEMHAKD